MDDFLIWVARGLVFWLDKIIYGFIPTVYNLLTDIAETTIFSDDVISLFSSRIYTLLGIFMLFKVSFSILTYIVDPDAFLDKSKGFGKLIFNVLVTLVLLIFTPWIFKQAMEIQVIVLDKNVLGKLFTTTAINTNVDVDPGNTMAYETFTAFYHLDTSLNPACDDSNIDNYVSYVNSCINSLSISGDSEGLKKNLEYSYNTKSVSIYTDTAYLYTKDSNGNYVMSYTPVISTLTGGAICLLLIVFCFDVAVRSIKLGFLRMLAPVPIISRLDPKKGKEMFDKWVKVCVSTYLDLFIRLLAIYFAIFVITQVISFETFNAVTNQKVQVGAFVKVFIILGALLFAKQLPKLIEELTGFKMDGKFTLNPLKKLNETGIPGLAAVGAAGLAGFAANAVEAKGADGGAPSVGRRILSGFGGLGSSMYNTGRNVIKNKGEKNFDSFRSGVSISSNNRKLREGGYGFVAKAQDVVTDMSGHKFSTGTTSMLKNEINNMEINLQNVKQSEEAARRTFYDSLNGTSSIVKDYFDFSIKEENGKFIGYQEKSLDDFLSKNGISRSDLSREEITAFENLLSNYTSVTKLDKTGRDIEKEIKDKKEQMENSKKKN